MANEQSDITRGTIFGILATDADGYYRLVLTVASSFLGGSLFFLEKFLPHPTLLTLSLLSVGWGSLVTSIALVTRVRLKNLQSGAFALEGKEAEARVLDAVKARETTGAARFLIWGMVFVVAAGVVSLWTRVLGGN